MYTFHTGDPYRNFSYRGVVQMMESTAKRAGITKHVHPHIFRHTRITDLMREGISEQTIKMFAWGTVTTEMLKVYAHLVPSDAENEMLNKYGIQTKNQRGGFPKVATPIQCTRCYVMNPVSNYFCGTCGAPLADDARNFEDN
jgi:hypothetical protein